MLFIYFIISVVISLKISIMSSLNLIHFQRSFALARLRSGMRSPSTSLRFTPWQVPVVPVVRDDRSPGKKSLREMKIRMVELSEMGHVLMNMILGYGYMDMIIIYGYWDMMLHGAGISCSYICSYVI